jgi:hypothetical protein
MVGLVHTTLVLRLQQIGQADAVVARAVLGGAGVVIVKVVGFGGLDCDCPVDVPGSFS